MPKRRKQFEQSLASTVESLAATTDRQSSMIERLLGALAGLLPGARSSPPENTSVDGEPVPDAHTPPNDELLLTTRELEVGAQLLAGRSRKEAAKELSVTPATVKSHASSLYKKLGIHSLAELRHHRDLFSLPQEPLGGEAGGMKG